jgi:hypothetical protein
VKGRRRTAAQKALAERRTGYRLWVKWRRERLDELLAGPYGAPARALLDVCKNPKTSPRELIAFVAAGPWAHADRDTRFEILSLLDGFIVKKREKAGLDPFDDALPGEPDSLFVILRAMLADPPPDGGAARCADRLEQLQHKSHEKQRCRTM